MVFTLNVIWLASVLYQLESHFGNVDNLSWEDSPKHSHNFVI